MKRGRKSRGGEKAKEDREGARKGERGKGGGGTASVRVCEPCRSHGQ